MQTKYASKNIWLIYWNLLDFFALKQESDGKVQAKTLRLKLLCKFTFSVWHYFKKFQHFNKRASVCVMSSK